MDFAWLVRTDLLARLVNFDHAHEFAKNERVTPKLLMMRYKKDTLRLDDSARGDAAARGDDAMRGDDTVRCSTCTNTIPEYLIIALGS
jgi:hypothetical protein